jgi:GT2 family glycosyltransferase
MSSAGKVAAIVIGRNEGERLKTCLLSLVRQVSHIVYVDSGSTDGSQNFASKLGIAVVTLSEDERFTAALARNSGFRYLVNNNITVPYIQFLDGDCELQSNWLSESIDFLDSNPDVAVVCGRRREKAPEASVYNWLTDKEWDTPTGYAKSCGGDALMRFSAFESVDGYTASLIAGEEPELCVRLRKERWKIYRLGAEMTLHDANITRFSQWWKRNRRAGHAYAEGAYIHGAPPERHGVRNVISALVWTLGTVFIILAGSTVSPLIFLLLGIWPLKMLHIGAREKSLTYAFFLLLSKWPETSGILSFVVNTLRRRQRGLMEYK